MQRTKIHTIQSSLIGKTILLKGWAKTVRGQKGLTFIELNDGSTLSGIQVVVDANVPNYEKILQDLSTGVSLQVEGILVESPAGHKQKWELQA
ncbi:MAG: asparagine--tRNA ligase, partial [Verrucomicrobia bacterium]|nr:asparagine--tRNA ligase [Verrucomicrobiota bacterium]